MNYLHCRTILVYVQLQKRLAMPTTGQLDASAPSREHIKLMTVVTLCKLDDLMKSVAGA